MLQEFSPDVQKEENYQEEGGKSNCDVRRVKGLIDVNQ